MELSWITAMFVLKCLMLLVRMNPGYIFTGKLWRIDDIRETLI